MPPFADETFRDHEPGKNHHPFTVCEPGYVLLCVWHSQSVRLITEMGEITRLVQHFWRRNSGTVQMSRGENTCCQAGCLRDVMS